MSIEKRMNKLMRKFLWGSVEGKKKMSWVNWTKISTSKQHGGLGVKNLRLTNKSILAKWVWRNSTQRGAL